jgi:ketosteroid isomerase-like protein
MESSGVRRDTGRAMSEENVEIVRKGFENFNQGDVDALLETADADVVLRPAPGGPERVYYGKDSVRSFYEDFAEAIGRDVVIEDQIDAGAVVVTRARFNMSGAQSGIEMPDIQATQVTTFRRGKGILIEFFWDHEEALEAAGLSE